MKMERNLTVRTWFVEQCVLVVCLAPGAILAIAQDPTARALLRTLLGVAAALLAQKARGAASRQQEQDARVLAAVGLDLSPLPCADKIARWSAVAQVVAVAQVAAGATSWLALFAALPPLAYVQLFGRYRRWRAARSPSARLRVPSLSGVGGAR